MNKKILFLISISFLIITLSGCTKKQISFDHSNGLGYGFSTEDPSDLVVDTNNLENNLEKNMNQEILKKYSKAEFQTSLGNFTIEFYNEKMPITVANFLNLADSGFYDGIKFHRVIKGFMIQAGDPLSKDNSMKDIWGMGGPGYKIQDEFTEGLSNVSGTISMANSGPNTGGSQFFINLADNIYLDFDKEPLSSKHPVFGRVVSGMDVVDKISKVKTELNDRPETPVVINKISLK
jgi:peptidylprolyl isomerase